MTQLNKAVRTFSFFILLMLFSAQSFADYPDPVDDYVNDFAGVIDEDHTSLIQSKLKSLESDTGIEMVVVTINSMRDYDSTLQYGLKNFAKKLFNKWGVGQLPDNDGVMLLMSVKDRMIRVHMGAGYNHRYDDDMILIIEDTITPEFKKRNFSEGLYLGTSAIMSEITRPPTFWGTYKWFIILGIIGLVMAGAGFSLLRKGKRGWGWALITLGGTIIGAVLLGLFTRSNEDHYQEGFGGGYSDDDGAEGSWDYDDD